MKRQLVKMSKTRGAAGLLVAALGILVSLAVPPSMRGWTDMDAAFAGAPMVRTLEGSDASSATVVEQPQVEAARQFHAVADPVEASNWSSGAIGMCLLAAFSLLLVIAAFFLRSAQAPRACR